MRSSRLMPSMLLVSWLAAPAFPAQEGGPSAEARQGIEMALQARQFSKAFELYDASAAQRGPSRALLSLIARASLEQGMAQGESWNRVEAARALVRLGSDAGRTALLKELRGAHSQVRARVARLVADAGMTEAVPDLRRGVEGLPGSSVAEKVQMARALYRLGETAAGREALAALAALENPAARMQALQALVELRDGESLETFKRYVMDENRTSALWANRGAAALGDTAAREQLLGWVTVGPTNLQALAAWHLAASGFRDFVPAAAKVASEALDHPMDAQRGMARAVYTLSSLDPAAGQPLLDRVMALEGYFNARLVGARRLVELGHETALAQIQKIYQEASGAATATHRGDLVRLTGWLGDSPQLRAFLEQAALDDFEHVRLAAVQVLAALGVEQSLASLRDLLADEDLAARIPAAEAILHFGTPFPGPLKLWEEGAEPAAGR